MSIEIPNVGGRYEVVNILDNDGNPVIVDDIDRFGQPTGTTSESQMLLALEGTKDQPLGSPWHVCPICSHEFPETEMVNINNTWYSIKYGCAEDKQNDPGTPLVDNTTVEGAL